MVLEPLNLTNIVLIPKVAHLMNLINFRPTSLCMVLYKILSKLMANQFQRVLECCITEAQSSFSL